MMIHRLLRALLSSLSVPSEHLAITGIIRFRLLPDWDEATWRYWWLPEWNSDHTRIIRLARLTPKDKERFTVHEVKNILTTSGRNQVLTYMSSTGTGTQGFAQYFAVGTTVISTVSPGDASVQGEIFRAVPSTATITGTQLDLATLIGSAQAVGTLTNAGLFGVNATSTTGSGTLMTHALLNNFVKANGATYTVDYLLNLT